ncbi:MAG: DUF2330 domain-containing protein [Pirellulales bacterium]
MTTFAMWFGGVRRRVLPALMPAAVFALMLASVVPVFGDGKVVRPRNYEGSLEEKSQEAIVVFHGSDEPGGAVEDLILKITVAGEAENFAWVVPLPSEPETKPEDAALFKELFDYVEARRRRQYTDRKSQYKGDAGAKAAAADKPVEVLSREVVGSYDVAVVKENEPGKLNGWLEAEGYQPLKDGEDVIEFYRTKGYVFACIKVAAKELAERKVVDLHPLRFTFKTGGRDGIYFPMRMTGLQSEPFDVNLYVFYRYWINERRGPFGYVHRGMELNYRDWDSPKCEPDGGKAWSAPETDPLLRDLADRVPTVAKFFQARYPGDRFYLTNIQAHGLRPADVRAWADDLWLFPAYRGDLIPHDARSGGVAAAAYQKIELANEEGSRYVDDEGPFGADGGRRARYATKFVAAAAVMLALVAVALLVIRAVRPK